MRARAPGRTATPPEPSRLELPGGGAVELEEPYATGRLWVATVTTGGLDRLEYLHRYGAPIRYGYVPRAWPLSAYQTVFARDPGSAEMPSAGRPFTDRIVTRLVTAGVLIAPILLHTGVASPEAHERPYPERFAVPASTARAVTDGAGGGRPGDRDRHHRRAGAGERGRPRRSPGGPRRGTPTWWSPRSGGYGSWTVC